jgi:hypothetical protein
VSDGVLGQTLPAVLRGVSSQMSFLPVSWIAWRMWSLRSLAESPPLEGLKITATVCGH